MLKSIYKNIIFFLKENKRDKKVAPVILTSVFASIIEIIATLCIGLVIFYFTNNFESYNFSSNNLNFINNFLDNLDKKTFFFLILLVFFLKFFFTVLSNYLKYDYLSYTYKKNAQKLSENFIRLPFENFQRVSQEKLSKILNHNLEKIFYNYFPAFFTLINELLINILLILCIFFTNGLNVLLVFTLLIASSFLLITIAKNISAKYYKQQLKYVGKLFQQTKDTHGLFKEFKISNTEKFFLQFINISIEQNSKYLKKYMFFQTSLRYFYELILIVIFLLVIIFVSFSNQTNFFNEKTIFLGVIFLRFYPNFNKIVHSMNVLNSMNPVLNETKEYFNDIKSFLEDVNFEEKNILIDKNSDFSIDSFNLSYNVSNQEIFQDLNFKIKRNDKIFICGPSGSGKSTLINIIAGQIKVKNGMLKYNGVDINKIKFANNFFGYISQFPFFINDGIEENISLNENKLKIDNDKIANIINFCGISHLRSRFEEEENINSILSGGERQMIAFARALYNDSPFLIFDEPTSGMDKDLRSFFYKKLETLEDKTIIIISHDVENKTLKNNKFFRKFEIKNKNIISD